MEFDTHTPQSYLIESALSCFIRSIHFSSFQFYRPQPFLLQLNYLNIFRIQL